MKEWQDDYINSNKKREKETEICVNVQGQAVKYAHKGKSLNVPENE